VAHEYMSIQEKKKKEGLKIVSYTQGSNLKNSEIIRLDIK